MGSLKSTNLLCSFVSFRNNGSLIGHYDNRPLWVPVGTNKDDLECPIQLKVRFADGALGVRLLRVSHSTVRIGVARGGRGSGLEGLAAPSMWAADALFLCGS